MDKNMIVFLVIMGLRLFVPLLIPRFPLPAIIAALIIDGVDQTVFQNWTTLNLDNYQSYDKALDIYYLVIAYLATMRNWRNLTAFGVSRFLIYYRLVGVVLFELIGWRSLLLIFPNTFEYFFIWYEAVRLRWNPVRMSKKLVLAAAAVIWVVIKLPQEYWIHVAQLDTTDLMAEHSWMAPAMAIGVVLLLALAFYVIRYKCPPADRKPNFDADSEPADVTDVQRLSQIQVSLQKLFDSELVEKIALLSLISIIFGQILPGVDTSPLQMTVGIAAIIVASTAVSQWFVRKYSGWETAARQFFTMAVVNFGLVLAAYYLIRRDEATFNFGAAVFFVFLITLIVTLFDRFRPSYLARVEAAGARS